MNARERRQQKREHRLVQLGRQADQKILTACIAAGRSSDEAAQLRREIEAEKERSAQLAEELLHVRRQFFELTEQAEGGLNLLERERERVAQLISSSAEERDGLLKQVRSLVEERDKLASRLLEEMTEHHKVKMLYEEPKKLRSRLAAKQIEVDERGVEISRLRGELVQVRAEAAATVSVTGDQKIEALTAQNAELRKRLERAEALYGEIATAVRGRAAGKLSRTE